MADNGNWDKIKGQWKQVTGTARKQWGKITDDELEQIKGERDILAGKIQERYGITKEEANKQVDEWANSQKF